MELTGNWKRWAVLVLLTAAFWFAGGFHVAAFASRGGARGWIYATLAYFAGAAAVTVVDHWVGTLDRTNLRWAYVVFGVLVICFSIICLHTMHVASASDGASL